MPPLDPTEIPAPEIPAAAPLSQSLDTPDARVDGGAEKDVNFNALPPQADFDLLPVVGIGGSAGSIRPLQEFFSLMPADSGLAFVVVVHLSPDYESQLPRLLQARTSMPVTQVREPVKVEPNHVYVIAPALHLSMQDGVVQASEAQQPRGTRVAVDLFFRTLAATHRAHAVAIVLSGTDSDGAIGIKRIKEQGGVTIAQDPAEAEYEGMPRSALDTGSIDWILPIKAMPAKLMEFARNEAQLQIPASEAPDDAPDDAPEMGDEDEVALREILSFLHSRTGHDFSHYKRPTILRRIARRLQVNSLTTFAAYALFLRTHPGETGALQQDLLISVTNFFRGKEAFAALESQIGRVFEGKVSGDSVRVWVPGCATGEEACSLAIILLEHAATLENPPQIQIFATDLDEEAARAAREGLYPATIAADVSPARLRRFFLLEQGRYRLKTEVRELILFASHNLLKDAPFSRLDLISCRNLLIYFGTEAQARVLQLFHFALRPGGLLFLGSAESVGEENAFFEPLDRENRLFVRNVAPRRTHFAPPPGAPSTLAPRAESGSTEPNGAEPNSAGANNGGIKSAAMNGEAATAPPGAPPAALPLPQWMERVPSPVLPLLTASPAAPRPAAFAPREADSASFGALHLQLLEQLAPPSVLVNEAYEVVHLSERANDYLQFAPGQISTQLLALVHPALRLELRAALFRATQSGQETRVEGVAIELDGAPRSVDLRVRPLRDPALSAGAAPRFLLVVFETGASALADTERDAQTASDRAKAEPIALRLEAEVADLKALLRETVDQYEASAQELKASNEELWAVNEELHAADEELETGKEEIQAVNEELSTLNQELRANVEQVSRSNSDLNNLISSTDIATIFLDREGRIRRYTPRALDLFQLISTDVGRPLSDLRHRLQGENLLDDARRALESLQSVEREISSEDGRAWMQRVVPYRAPDGSVDGVVLTFVDISTRKSAEDRLRMSEEQLRFATNAAQIYAWEIDVVAQNGRYSSNQPAVLGFAIPVPLEGAFALLHPDDREAVKANFGLTQSVGALFELEFRFVNPHSGAVIWVASHGTVIEGAPGGGARFVGISQNITPRKLAEAALLESEGRFRAITEVVPDLLWSNATSGRVSWFNAAWLEYTGVPLEAALGDGWIAVVHPDDRDLVRRTLQSALKRGEPLRMEERIRNAAGEYRWFLVQMRPQHGAAGEILRWFGAATDIHEQRETLDALSASEARFRAMFEQTSVGVVLASPDGQILAPNPGFCQIVGCSEAEARKSTIADVTHPDDYPREAALLKQMLAGEIPGFSIEKRLRHCNGKLTWATMTATPVRAAEGEPLYVMSIVEDISERKSAEAALRQSEERFRAIVHQAMAGVAEYDLSGNHLFVNGTFAALLGYTPDEMTGMPLQQVVYAEDWPQCHELFERAIRESGSFVNEKRVLAKDGSVLWINESIASIRDALGQAQSVVTVAIDASARKAAEEVLRQSEARYRAIVGQATAGIALTELTGRFVQVNDYMALMLGFSALELSALRVQDLIHPDDVALAQAKLTELIERGTAFEIENRCQCKSGDFLWVNASVSVVRGGDGAPQLACIVMVDVSERKRAQQEILKANNELEARVQTRTQELGVALDTVRQESLQRQQAEIGRDKLLRQIVGTQEEERRRISRELHDNMGQHLTAILLAISALETHNQCLDFPERRAGTGIERLRQMVDELLAVSHRLAWEIRPALLDNVGLRAALEQYVASWQDKTAIQADFVARIATQSGGEKTTLSPEAETALFRVAQEALTNVQRHSGATLVSVLLEAGEESATLIIEDNGRGLDGQTSDYSSRLGLLGMKERMELVGGTLTLESGEGAGLTVYARVSGG